MDKLAREDLLSLEQYAQTRDDFRAKVMAHKKDRAVHIGSHATLYFEDRLTIQYQIQEMLRIERIFESEGIEEELGTYNPLIPDGNNWKATMMIEYEDVEERKQALAQLIGIERKTWMQVDGFERVHPIANEDLERETEDKTSAVHFMRFELTPEMTAAIKQGAAINIGINHKHYIHSIEPLPEHQRASLAADIG
ncbi:MAG: DUF3501 family protein [Gammaproteobacteria bacterium]|nr:MAG: DUF3501 family protein [Gammaproteobacteria bacterium]